MRTWDLGRLILPITYFVEKPFQNWSRVSTEPLGTIILYLDYQVPMGELRKELKRLVENNPKWDRKVCGLQVTDAKQSTIEVRALLSSTDPGKTFDLRCEVREGLIQFLYRNIRKVCPVCATSRNLQMRRSSVGDKKTTRSPSAWNTSAAQKVLESKPKHHPTASANAIRKPAGLTFRPTRGLR